ncbi:MAG: nucleotidyltransferase family protein [Chloroflexi bacterium]|nr:nucleotidyltransferase family protein [Chloroflexota bacterium]
MASRQTPSPPPLQWRQGYGAIVLAAGLSTRMGENKLLLPWQAGAPIVAHVTRQFLLAGIETIVVTGRDAALVRAALAGLSVRCIHNPAFATGGMLSSVQAGLRALPDILAAAFIQPADMPGISMAVIKRLAREYETGWSVAPSHDGRRGHPLLLDRSRWTAMLALDAPAMPREALDKSRLRLLPVDEPGVLVDVDTPQAYRQALAGQASSPRKDTPLGPPEKSGGG